MKSEGTRRPRIASDKRSSSRFLARVLPGARPAPIAGFIEPCLPTLRDAAPFGSRTNEFQVTPTTLGTFKGKCAELCGVNHSRMLFVVKVVTPEEFAQHQIDLKARGQVGNLLDGRTSDQANGKQGTTIIGGTP